MEPSVSFDYLVREPGFQAGDLDAEAMASTRRIFLVQTADSTQLTPCIDSLIN